MSIYENINNVDEILNNDVINFVTPKAMPWNNIVVHTVHCENIRIDNILIDGNRNIINFNTMIEENKQMKTDILKLKSDIDLLKNRLFSLLNITEL